MRLAKSLVVTAIAGCLVAGSPAYSADFTQILQQFSSSVRSWSDLESRLNVLTNQLNSAQLDGSLSGPQVIDFKGQIEKIRQEEVATQSTGAQMSVVDMFKYTNRLSLLATQVNQTMQVKQSAVPIPDVATYQVLLKKQIVDARSANQLTQQDADKLSQDLRIVGDMESGFKSTGDGTLTLKQAELLTGKLDLVKAAIAQQIAQSQSAIPEITSRREALQKKISDAASILTAEQSNSLKTELAQIATTQASYTTSGNISGSQIYSLATALDKLDRKIDDALGGRVATIPGSGTNPRDPRDTYAGDGSTWRDRAGNRNPDGSYIDGSYSRSDRNPRDLVRPGYPDQPGGLAGDGSPRNDRYPQDNRYPRDNSGGYRDSNLTNPDDVAVAPPRRGSSSRNGNGSGVDNHDMTDTGSHLNTSETTSLDSTISGTTYRDVQGYWGEPYISVLASRGIIGGFPDGSFKPNDQITRAQFAAIAAKALSVPTAGASASFRDVPARHWAANVISAVSSAGLVTGFPDGTFRPEDKITRAQALVILAKALKGMSANASELNAYSDASEVPSWAQQSVSIAANGRIIVNYPEPSLIRPSDLATRGEVAGLMYQTLLNTGKDLPRVTIGVLHPKSTRR